MTGIGLVRKGRPLALLLLLSACPISAHGQSPYVHPHLGALSLDIDPAPFLAAEIDEEILLGFAFGHPVARRVAIEVLYASAGFEIRAAAIEPIPGRFHLVGAGPRVLLLDLRPVELWASFSPGILIGTAEGVESTDNLAAPIGLGLVLWPDRRVRLRADARDLLHRCDPPRGFDGILCREGEWLHHVATSVGVEMPL